MAKLTFHQRYISDTRFKERADGLLMESIYAHAGIDAEDLCRRWEAGDRDLKLKDVRLRPEKAEVQAKAPAKPRTTTRRSTKKADAKVGGKG